VEGLLPTAGERLAIRCPPGWIADSLAEGADGCFIPGPPDGATVRVRVEPDRSPFPVTGWAQLARDGWCRDGHVVLRDVATSGFDLHAWQDGAIPELVLRWRPPRRTRAAALALRARARLLTWAVLLQYPVLWAASVRGRAPLHAAALTAGSRGSVLLVGPSGSGKTTLVTAEVAALGQATADNIVVGDGNSAWGLVEPLRSEQGQGRREPHGRRTDHLAGRVPALEPAVLVVLGRGADYRVEACPTDSAARALVASTYAAGELRRYWGVHALLALGTGVGPAHPPVSEIASAFACRLRCLRVDLPKVRGERLADHLAAEGAEAWMT
jgi:hypothetical protein